MIQTNFNRTTTLKRSLLLAASELRKAAMLLRDSKPVVDSDYVFESVLTTDEPDSLEIEQPRGGKLKTIDSRN